MAKLYSKTGTLAATTEDLDTTAALGVDVAVEVMIVNTHVSNVLTFVDTAGVSHPIAPNKSLVLPVSFRAGTITGTGTYFFYASNEAGFVARQVTEQSTADGEVTTGKIADDAVDKDKINADVAGLGLVQNVDGSLEVSPDGTMLELVGDTIAIKASGVGPTELATNAVETLKIADLNVTTGKLAVGIISADADGRAKLADGLITATEFADGAAGKFGTNAINLATTATLNVFAADGLDETALAKLVPTNGISEAAFANLFALLATGAATGSPIQVYTRDFAPGAPVVITPTVKSRVLFAWAFKDANAGVGATDSVVVSTAGGTLGTILLETALAWGLKFIDTLDRTAAQDVVAAGADVTLTAGGGGVEGCTIFVVMAAVA